MNSTLASSRLGVLNITNSGSVGMSVKIGVLPFPTISTLVLLTSYLWVDSAVVDNLVWSTASFVATPSILRPFTNGIQGNITVTTSWSGSVQSLGLSSYLTVIFMCTGAGGCTGNGAWALYCTDYTFSSRSHCPA